MTQSEIEAIGLPITIDGKTAIMVESALLWIENHTTYVCDITCVASFVKLFILKYIEIMAMTAGITDESIEGLEQSFDNSTKEDLLRQYANILMGGYLKSDVSVTCANRRWF